MATDDFGTFTDNVSSPANKVAAVTPHDVNELPRIPKALYVGTAGNITLRAKGDSGDVLLKNVPAGAILPVRAQYVRLTGTTAADIVAIG